VISKDGRLDQAEEELRMAIKLDLSFAPAYFDRGRVLNAMNRPQDAKKAFEDYGLLQR
jgi:hypothetical protein